MMIQNLSLLAVASLMDSIFVQGTVNLISDVSLFLTVLSPLAGVAFFTYCIIRKGGADPQAPAGRHPLLRQYDVRVSRALYRSS